MNETELKHCPFCGSTRAPEIMLLSAAESVDEGDPFFEWASQNYVVVCNYNRGGCGASISAANCPLPELAAEKWNTRFSKWRKGR